MAVAILLAPATRVGYLLYPVDFFVWAWLLRSEDTVDMPVRGRRRPPQWSRSQSADDADSAFDDLGPARLRSDELRTGAATGAAHCPVLDGTGARGLSPDRTPRTAVR